jgi:YD repeat-containing protein
VRYLGVYFLFGFLQISLHLAAQMPQPAVPDNTLNSTNTIGLPPASSKEGTAEVVNLNNGALTLFLPIVTLPQRAGAAPLELGFTYDSNQVNLQQILSDSVEAYPGPDGSAPEIVDYLYYTDNTAQIEGVFSAPLDLNIPQLSASLEYFGDYLQYDQFGDDVAAYGPRYCLTNVTFRDWKGSIHAFPNAVVACDIEEPTDTPLPSLVLVDNSNDNEFYHLDTSNRADYVVYAPDGTAYHFANPHLPCYPYTDFGLNCPQFSSAEQYILKAMTSSVDRFGNTMTLGSVDSTLTLTDTVGRLITITSNWQTGSLSINYSDPNGTPQSVTLTPGLPAAESTIPESTGLDVGPYLQSNSCFIQAPSPGGYPILTPQYSLNIGAMPDGWTPPVENASREFNGLSVYYSSTGESYTLLFDYFGHLMKINYPEGGYHRYDYALYSTPPRTQGPITCSWPVAEVAHRYECTNISGSCTQQQEAVTTYTPFDSNPAVSTNPCSSLAPVFSQNQTPWVASLDLTVPNSEMMVQDPDGAITFHCFNSALNLGLNSQLTNLETDNYQYSPAGSLLRQTHNDYATAIESGQNRPDLGAGYPFPIKTTTTLFDTSPSISSYTTFSYDTVPSNIDPFPYSSYVQVNPQVVFVDNPIQTDVYGYDGTHLRSTSQSWAYLGSAVHLPNNVTDTDPGSGAQSSKTIGYDGSGRVTSYVESGTNVAPLTWIYTPDQWGRPTAIQDPNGNTTHYSYSDEWVNSTCAPSSNSQAYLTSVTNAKQQTTTYSYYSCSGQLGLSVDPNNVAVSLAYDGASRIKQRQVASSAGTASYLTVAYQDGPGSTITRTELANPNPSVVTLYSLDGLGRVFDQSVQSDPQGPTHITTTFNPQGEVQSVTNPYRTTSDSTYGITSYLYDPLGRKTTQCQPDNGGSNTQNCVPSNSYLQWVYSGNVVTSSDETGREWQRTTDALGRLTNVVELGSSAQPMNLSTTYTYDTFGNLTAVNQNGQSGDTPRTQRRFTYDGLSRLITAFNPETGTMCYGQWSGGSCVNGYDGDSNLLYKTDARGVITNYAYDNLNRLISKTYTNAPPGSMSSCYAFDTTMIGKLAAEWTQAGACPTTVPTSEFQTMRKLLSYNAMGQVTSETQCTPNATGFGNCVTSSPNPFTLSYTYDLAGNLTQYTNGIGSIQFTPQYDGAGRLSTLTSSWNDSLHPPTLFTADPSTGYTAAGAIQSMILGNNIFINKTYDNRLRTTGETAAHP